MAKYCVEWTREDGIVFHKFFNTMNEATEYQENLVFVYGYDAEVL